MPRVDYSTTAMLHTLVQRIVLQVLIIFFFSSFLVTAQTLPLLLWERDPVERNLITMSCLSATTGSLSPDAIFYVDGSILYNPNPVDPDAPTPPVRRVGESEILYGLTQSMEGGFSCAIPQANNLLMSDQVTLVGESVNNYRTPANSGCLVITVYCTFASNNCLLINLAN